MSDLKFRSLNQMKYVREAKFSVIQNHSNTQVKVYNGGLKILLIGDENGISNNALEILKTISRNQRVNLKFKKLSIKDLKFEEYYNSSKLNEIEANKFDIVIFHADNEYVLENESEFFYYGKQLIDRVKASYLTSVLFIPWTSKTTYSDQYLILDAYKTLALNENILTIPAGNVWQDINESDEYLENHLYTFDRSNTSELGSYLNAIIIYKFLTGNSTINIHKNLKLKVVKESVVRRLNFLVNRKNDIFPF